MDLFQQQIEDILDEIGRENLTYNEDETWMYQRVYSFIEQYSREHHLRNTAIALPVVRHLYNGIYRGTRTAQNGEKHRRPYLCHSLSVCRMLINLQPQLVGDEQDIVLAAALCHDLRDRIPFRDKGREMETVYHLDHRIPEILMLIYEGDCESEEDYQKVFEGVMKNKLATLVRLADRGDIVEELYNVSPWKAHELIYETRNFYMPMCFYAREHYPELDTCVGILQEKMYELVLATDIFVTRYENREKELSSKILLLQEENSRLRTIIRRKKEEAGK